MSTPTTQILFVSKYGSEDTAGNAVAIRRLSASLEALGVRARCVQSGQSPGEAAIALFGFDPTIVHALHAGESARLGAALADAFSVPLVVTVTGTDLNGAERNTDEMMERLAAADAVVALTEDQVDELKSLAPEPAVVRIPQAVVLGTEAFDLRGALSLIGGARVRGRKLALLAGGLRPVKGQLFALEAFAEAGERLSDWLLVIAGPVLEKEYAETVRARAGEVDSALYIGEIAHDSMPAAMASCDVLLNSSESEGEPQVILEAQCTGLPVVARRVPGNASLVEHGVTGWLFDSGDELCELLAGPASDAEARKRVVQGAREARGDRLDPGLEARRHLDLYRSLAASTRRRP